MCFHSFYLNWERLGAQGQQGPAGLVADVQVVEQATTRTTVLRHPLAGSMVSGYVTQNDDTLALVPASLCKDMSADDRMQLRAIAEKVVSRYFRRRQRPTYMARGCARRRQRQFKRSEGDK